MLYRLYQLICIMVLLGFLIFVGSCFLPLASIVGGTPAVVVILIMLIGAFISGLWTIIRP